MPRSATAERLLGAATPAARVEGRALDRRETALARAVVYRGRDLARTLLASPATRGTRTAARSDAGVGAPEAGHQLLDASGAHPDRLFPRPTRFQGANAFSTPRSAGSSSGKCRSSTSPSSFVSTQSSPARV